MTKFRIFTIVSIIIVLSLFGIIMFFSFLNNNSSNSSNGGTSNKLIKATDSSLNYEVSINEYNSTINGKVTKNGSYGNYDDVQLRQFADIYINQSGDVLWAQCLSGYNILSANSKTKNAVTFDPNIGANITLIPNQQNNLTIVCGPK